MGLIEVAIIRAEILRKTNCSLTELNEYIANSGICHNKKGVERTFPLTINTNI
jgi:hypothetical protein